MLTSKRRNLHLINEHLTCTLCSGYLIDAWTINECLHSFCRPCIFSYFNDNDENTACPTCSTVPHPAKPLLGVTKDCWLQQLVYKLVPSLFKREMCQRRIYYDAHAESKSKLIEQHTKTHPSQMGCREEELGELSERCLFQQKDKFNNHEKIHIKLEYNESDGKIEGKHVHYLECSSTMPIKIFKEYFRKILPLSKRSHYQIDVLFDQKVLLDNFTLSHVHSWKQNHQEKHKQLHLFYRIIILEREPNESISVSPVKMEADQGNIMNSTSTCDSSTAAAKPPAFVRSSNIYHNPNSFVHTTPFSPAEARTISLNNTITEQLHGTETTELIKAKECTMLDCKTFATSKPINYSMESINNISKPKKRAKKSMNTSEQAPAKKCKTERKKKGIKEEKSSISVLTSPAPVTPLTRSPSENENPNELNPQKHLSYSEVIQEANKLLAAEEPMTPPNATSSSLLSLNNPVTARLTKPIATVSPLHTSKGTNYRMQEKLHDEQLIDLSKSNCTAHPPADEIPLKLESKDPDLVNAVAPPERKKRSRQTSSSTTRTKVSRNSNKSTHDDGTDSSKSLKKTLSHTHPNPYLPPPASQQHQQQQMFQNFFHTFQNQANYWPMSPWPVPPSLALMADPRNYYSQPWPTAHPSSAPHGPKDLSSASLNDFIGDTLPSTSASVFPMPPSSVLLSSTPNFSRTSSSNSLHLHHGPTLHRPTTLNGTLS